MGHSRVSARFATRGGSYMKGYWYEEEGLRAEAHVVWYTEKQQSRMSRQQCYYTPVHHALVQGHRLRREEIVYCGCSPQSVNRIERWYETHLASIFSLYHMCVARREAQGWVLLTKTIQGVDEWWM